MEEFANENNMLRLDIDGGQMYLPFAKRKLQEMKRLMSMRGITVDNRVIDVDEAEIFVQSIPGFDYIRITERPAKPGILLIFIRDTSLEPDGCDYQLVYDTSNGRNGKDYRALLYRLNDKGGDVELSPDGLMGDGLSVTDTGLTLNIQSGGGVYAAELPSIFVYNDMIDFAEFKLTAWGSILTLLNQQRVVGSRYISAWTKAQVGTAYKYAEDASQFMRMSSSRHAYTSGSDGYINACMFKNQQSLLGTGVMYRELSLTPEDSFYQLWKNEIAYKTTPDDTGYISGKLVGSDYITGTPWQTGYNWETYQVIDIFDKDNALVKVVSNLITKGGNQLLPYTINLTVRSRWYIEIPPTFFTTEDTWVYNGQTAVLDTTCVRTERLMVGDLEIESTQYEEYRYDSDYLNWIPGAVPGMTLVSHSGDAHGGYGDGAISASGSISGPNKFNAELKVETFLNTSTGRDNVRWWPVSIGERHVGRRTGYRDIHVTAFDNMDGANCFIIMYKKSYVYFTDSVDVPNVNDGTTPVPVTEQIEKPTVATHHIAYKTKGGTLVKADLTGDIRAASCQINNGFMAYTYCTFVNGSFASRTIGTIDINSGTKRQWQTDDNDQRLSGFTHVHHAAIGVL